MYNEKYVPIGTRIEVLTNAGTRKEYFQTGSGDYLGCSFTLTEAGCQSAVLSFAKFANIARTDIIKITIFNSSVVYFTGVIRDIPIEGSTEQRFSYRAFGLTDYLGRLNTLSSSYAAQSVRSIVIDLLDNIIVPNSPITKNLSKIDTLSTVVSSVNFKYLTVKAALDQLKNIADTDGNDYRVGVDEEGDFYFYRRNTSTIATLFVGKRGAFGIEEYNPTVNFNAVSKIHVLKKDGTFFKTFTSAEEIDIHELKLTGPDIADADLDNWAEGQLKELEQVSREASVDWQIKDQDPLFIEADGNIRILSNINPPSGTFLNISLYGQGAYGSGPYGGYSYTGYELDDTLKIKQITYTINDAEASMKLQLGKLPVELDREVLKINKDLQDLKVSLGR